MKLRNVTAALLLLSLTGLCASQEREPDYTKGETPKGHRHFWNLGPTGASGYIWTRGGNRTVNTRMILIKEVHTGSPADGVLKVGDVILGIGNTEFASDACKALADAITEAETKEKGGKLSLYIWRRAKVMDEKAVTGTKMSVTIQLEVLGAFSNTSPWKCEKSEAIINRACQYVVDRGLWKVGRNKSRHVDLDIDKTLDALGLLATGEEKYLPIVRAYARAIGGPKTKLDLKPGMQNWGWAYKNLLLTEYYLATKDDYVLPAIKEYSTKIAMGSSGVGTWGHGPACPSENGGKLHGPPSGYGAMNQISLTLSISLILAQKCGVQNDEIEKAVARSADFFRWFCDKGAIPYGDHAPMASLHDNNGVCSQAAIMYDLLGDKKMTHYYTRMTVASYDERCFGHTGHFFSWQWGALGAARGGGLAAQSFVKNTRWYVELERRHDVSFVYQRQLGSGGGKYMNWSATGSRIMQLCLPRKKLYITGKGGKGIALIAGEKLKQTVAAGRYKPSKDAAITDLLKELGSWSPCVRLKTATALGFRDENVVEQLIAMLDSENRYARYGACLGLRYAGRRSSEAVDALVKCILESDDLTLRYFAMSGLMLPSYDRHTKHLWRNALDSAALKAAPALLKLAAIHDPVQDPQRKLHSRLADLLFYSGNVSNHRGFFAKGKGLDKVDRALLIPAIKSMLVNPNGGTRSLVAGIYPYLTEEDLEQLWGYIYYATKSRAPSGVMFAGSAQINGLKLMAKYGVKEGMDAGVDVIVRQKGWGNWGRKNAGFPALKAYGPALVPYYPELEKPLDEWAKSKDEAIRKKGKEHEKRLDEMRNMPMPKIISIEKHIKEVEIQK